MKRSLPGWIIRPNFSLSRRTEEEEFEDAGEDDEFFEDDPI
jgi:hypothetical protein